MSSWLKRWKYCPKKKMTFIQVQPDFLWFKSVICLSLYFPLFCICHLCILITVKFTKDIMDGFFNSIEAIVRDLTDLKRRNMKYKRVILIWKIPCQYIPNACWSVFSSMPCWGLSWFSVLRTCFNSWRKSKMMSCASWKMQSKYFYSKLAWTPCTT